jgi:hypothetical protein
MRSDMEDMPEELQTPENIICSEFDNGDAGKRVIDILKEFGYVIVKEDDWKSAYSVWYSHR